MRAESSAIAALLFFCVGSSSIAACSSGGSGDDVDSAGAGSAQTELRAALACDVRDGNAAATLKIDPNGRSVLDLEKGETKRYASEFTVSDPEIASQLSAKVAHIQDLEGNVVLRGDIADPNAFDFFEDWTVGNPTTHEVGNKVRVVEQTVGVVHRVQGQENQVRIVFNHTTQTKTCSTYFEDAQCAFDQMRNEPGKMDVQRQDDPIVDHVFATCRAP